MKVIFMGTPDFSVGTLEAIIGAGHEVALVVTQPDKPKGRGNTMTFPPVKECALAHNLPVYQPEKIRKPECVEYLKTFDADIFIVVAFGQILPQEILDMPRFGCVNVHASLLPKYRGASPIQWAVINGERVSGVTTMRMDAGVDTGDIIAQREVALAPDETGGSLFDRLSDVGAKLCVETMQQIENHTAVYTPQDGEKATHTGMISKELGHIDWTKPAEEIERLVRGLNPWPSAYTHLDGKTLKIWKSAVVPGQNASEPGRVVSVSKDSVRVATGDGILALNEVQLEGKKRMPCDAFLRGCHVEEGAYLV
jgi:methionyl-tRNA formyltransferase